MGKVTCIFISYDIKVILLGNSNTQGKEIKYKYEFCGAHENVPLKFPAVGNTMGLQPQQLCCRIHHCHFAKAMSLMDYSQLIIQAGPFLKKVRLH